MQKTLMISGAIFLVIGVLVFFISQEITVKVELMPFSFALVMVLVAGVIMLGVGIVKSVGDLFS